VRQTTKAKIVSKMKSFPGMSGNMARLLNLLDDPDSSASQIEEVLRYEPGITANLLKMTNSAYFGLPTKVGSIKKAIVMLGWKRLSKLVMASCVNAMMDDSIPGYDLPPGELWRHSIAVSVAAEGLIRELKIGAGDEIFTAALLHDLGKLVLGGFVREDLDAIRSAAARGMPFQLAEREVLGTDHAEIGGQMLESWSFPENLVNAVRWHHEPDSAEETSNTIDIVHVANVLCLMIGIGVGVEGLQYEPSPAATKRLGLRPGQLELVASQTLEWANELSDMYRPT